MRIMRDCTALILAALICSSVAEGAAPVPGEKGNAKRTIAVMYFQNNAMMNREAMAPLEKGLTDMLITELSKIEGLSVVERAQLQQLTREMGLGATGAIKPETAQQMGKLLGAETLLLGSFATDMSGKKMRIDARIVETETGLTLKAEEETDKRGLAGAGRANDRHVAAPADGEFNSFEDSVTGRPDAEVFAVD